MSLLVLVAVTLLGVGVVALTGTLATIFLYCGVRRWKTPRGKIIATATGVALLVIGTSLAVLGRYADIYIFDVYIPLSP